MTDTTQSDETIRKIWAKDLKAGETIHTVFRATFKEKITSRAGKSFLKLSLVDRTGSIDARIFDNVAAADGAFSTDDYLLVKGKVDQFKGHPQLVIEKLERLDAGPIDASEFAYTPPAPPPPREERKHEEAPFAPAAKVRLSKRLDRLLEHPALAQALDNFVGQLEKVLAAHPPPPRPEKKPREPREARGPKVENKPRPEKHDEPKRDASLPEGLAFKPFNALVPAPAADEKPATPTGNDSSGS